MHVRNRSDIRLVGFCPVHRVIDRKQMLLWKRVAPLDQERFAATGLESRAGNGARVSPLPRRLHITMNPRLEFPHLHRVKGDLLVRIVRIRPCLGAARNGWDRQSVDVTLEGLRIQQHRLSHSPCRSACNPPYRRRQGPDPQRQRPPSSDDHPTG